MNTSVEWTAIAEQLERCQRAGVIDRYSVRSDDVILIQGRYAHRIPTRDVSVFLSGMIQYARAAGVDSVSARPHRRRHAA